MLNRLTGCVNLRLAITLSRVARAPNPRELLNAAELALPDPEVWFVYEYAVAVAWFLLMPVLGLFCIGAIALAAYVGQREAEGAVTRVLYFATAFCLVGGLDAAWRTWLVQLARRRYRRNGRAFDSPVRRLMKVAAINDLTLALQVAAGIVSAVVLR
ncbi:MAG TPA: hypothetical protein VLJ44_07765 [Gaiellaceae bacterium]|nr:hypothetical protein [Gaiellaceae bacterium]